MKFDLTKYGFELEGRDEDDIDGVYTWRMRIDDVGEMNCPLLIFVGDVNNYISIDCWYGTDHLYIASRYKCDSYEQLEFLLFNSTRIKYYIQMKMEEKGI